MRDYLFEVCVKPKPKKQGRLRRKIVWGWAHLDSFGGHILYYNYGLHDAKSTMEAIHIGDDGYPVRVELRWREKK